MTREIKFRVWDGNKMSPIDELRDLPLTTTEGGHVLMQYAGLKDKNGKEIFEGDILKYKDETLKPVEAKPTGFIGLDIFNELTDPELKNTEIIGNIYEHPHLLENNND